MLWQQNVPAAPEHSAAFAGTFVNFQVIIFSG